MVDAGERRTRRTLPPSTTRRAARGISSPVRALNGAGPSTLLLAMQEIMNPVSPGLIGREAALYRQWMAWRTSNRSGRPLSMGNTYS